MKSPDNCLASVRTSSVLPVPAGPANSAAPRRFSADEVDALVAAALQVTPIITAARVLHRFVAPTQERLWTLARNLWWSWDQDTIALFRDLDPERWHRLNHNPISLLSELPLAVLEKRANDLALHARISYAYRRQNEYLSDDQTWAWASM